MTESLDKIRTENAVSVSRWETLTVVEGDGAERVILFEISFLSFIFGVYEWRKCANWPGKI